MTREQAKELYGEGTVGYVNCYDCPLNKGLPDDVYNEMCPSCKTGVDECWDAIAKFMSKEDDDDFEHCEGCVYDVKDPWEEPCTSCRHGIPYSAPEHDTAPSYYIPKGEVKEEPTEPIKPKEDVVNHPSHYTTGGMECIDEMILVFGEATVADFCLCNVWKYRKRALHKNGQEDLDKADWYMNKYKELIEKRHMGVDEYVRQD